MGRDGKPVLTLRNVTDEAGYVVVGYDDYPYGARMPQGATPSVGGSTRQFTGHERDLATGLDYMGARYYGAGVASFLSADSGVSETQDPRSWNGFAYTLGTPVRLVDPTGNDTFEQSAFQDRLRLDPLFAIGYEAWKADCRQWQRVDRDLDTKFNFATGEVLSKAAGAKDERDRGVVVFGPYPGGSLLLVDSMANDRGLLNVPEVSILLDPAQIAIEEFTAAMTLDGSGYAYMMIMAYAKAFFEEGTTALDAGSHLLTPSELRLKEDAEDTWDRPEQKQFLSDVEDWLREHGFSPPSL